MEEIFLAVNGIGKKTAERLVADGVQDLKDLLERGAEYLTSLPGINSHLADQIIHNVSVALVDSDVITMLNEPAQEVSLWPVMAKRLHLIGLTVVGYVVLLIVAAGGAVATGYLNRQDAAWAIIPAALICAVIGVMARAEHAVE